MNDEVDLPGPTSNETFWIDSPLISSLLSIEVKLAGRNKVWRIFPFRSIARVCPIVHSRQNWILNWRSKCRSDSSETMPAKKNINMRFGVE